MMGGKKQIAVSAVIGNGAYEFAMGAAVRVDITGRVVGRSEFAEGPPTYCIEYERRGKPQREWIVGDKLAAVGANDKAAAAGAAA